MFFLANFDTNVRMCYRNSQHTLRTSFSASTADNLFFNSVSSAISFFSEAASLCCSCCEIVETRPESAVGAGVPAVSAESVVPRDGTATPARGLYAGDVSLLSAFGGLKVNPSPESLDEVLLIPTLGLADLVGGFLMLNMETSNRL